MKQPRKNAKAKSLPAKQTNKSSGLLAVARIPPTVLWTVGAWLMLLASTPFFLVEGWRVFDMPDRSLLGQGRVWDPWLAVVADANSMDQTSFILACLVAAFFLSANAVRSSVHWIVLVAAVLGLSNVEPRATLATVVCVGLSGFLAKRGADAKTSTACWQTLAFAIALFLLSVVSSLEVGLISIALTLAVVLPVVKRLQAFSDSWSPVAGALACWITVVVLPTLFDAGYVGVLLRPISWMWLRPPTELMPSMTVVWRASEFGWPHGLAMLVLVERWRRVLLGRGEVAEMLFVALLTIVGLGCSRYFWLALATAIMTSASTDRPDPETSETHEEARRKPTLSWLPGVVICSVGMAAMLVQLVANVSTVFASDVIVRRLAPSQWNVSGVVMLANLEQTADWQSPSMRSDQGHDQYQPVLTDRWDAFHAEYWDYLATYRDWTNWKREAYLRSDGGWGGYQAVFSEWKPVFVALDTRDLDGMHSVSLDSQWKLVGVDPWKTVFARSESKATEPYVQYASRALAILEFPRPGGDMEFERVVVRGGHPSGAYRVSLALTSLRLPFAGLRVLPTADSLQRGACTTFASIELANRSHRYSGTFSLLDNVRALGRPQLFDHGDARETVKRYASMLRRQLDREPETRAEDGEQKLRAHLRHARLDDARSLTSQIGEVAVREFYAVLVAAADQPSAATLDQLQKLPTAELPMALASECSFYIGCLANELGDVGLAQKALAESARLDEASPFASIIGFYLSQVE